MFTRKLIGKLRHTEQKKEKKSKSKRAEQYQDDLTAQQKIHQPSPTGTIQLHNKRYTNRLIQLHKKIHKPSQNLLPSPAHNKLPVDFPGNATPFTASSSQNHTTLSPQSSPFPFPLPLPVLAAPAVERPPRFTWPRALLPTLSGWLEAPRVFFPAFPFPACRTRSGPPVALSPQDWFLAPVVS